MCICCKPGEEGEIIGTIRSDDRGGPENFEVGTEIFCNYQNWKCLSYKNAAIQK